MKVNRNTQRGSSKSGKEDGVTVSVPIYVEDLRDRVISSLTAAYSERMDEQVTEAVSTYVKSVVDRIAEKEIMAAVKSALSAGWNKTDNYGAVTGQVTLKDRISQMLNASDGYGSHRRWLDELVKKETEAALKGELAKEIESARAKLRAEVDSVTRAKLNEALRNALGVQP